MKVSSRVASSIKSRGKKAGIRRREKKMEHQRPSIMHGPGNICALGEFSPWRKLKLTFRCDLEVVGNEVLPIRRRIKNQLS
jgi:hypothetical protein